MHNFHFLFKSFESLTSKFSAILVIIFSNQKVLSQSVKYQDLLTDKENFSEILIESHVDRLPIKQFSFDKPTEERQINFRVRENSSSCDRIEMKARFFFSSENRLGEPEGITRSNRSNSRIV